MSAPAEPTLLARAFDWLKARTIRDNELQLMSRADLQLLACDIGVTEADLRDVVPHIRDHSDLLDKMMRARGLDPTVVRRAFGGVRDIERTCARCRDSGVCRKELEAGTAAARCHEFCANADAIDDLIEIRG